LGTLGFARLLAELALVSNALYLAAVASLAARLPALGLPLMRTCAVGFSGVLFGLKVRLACLLASRQSAFAAVHLHARPLCVRP
jgi:hypothetical protein